MRKRPIQDFGADVHSLWVSVETLSNCKPVVSLVTSLERQRLPLWTRKGRSTMRADGRVPGRALGQGATPFLLAPHRWGVPVRLGGWSLRCEPDRVGGTFRTAALSPPYPQGDRDDYSARARPH